MKLEFTLNDRPLSIECPPARRVVDLLRGDLGLTGTKEACGAGECGACTIIVDGVTRLACLMLAAQLEGCRVTTIEGLTPAAAADDSVAEKQELSPLQEAFIAGGAVQCGFCTPGVVLTAHNFLEDHPDSSPGEIRAALAGNLCRCTGYQKIIESIRLAAAGGVSGGVYE